MIKEIIKKEVIEMWELNFEDIKEDIKERLDNYHDVETYFSDLPFLLVEEENCNGSWEMYTTNNEKLFFANLDLFQEIYDSMEKYGNEEDLNILNGNIDKVVCYLMIELYHNIILQALYNSSVDETVSDELLLNEYNTNAIIKSLDELENPYQNLK